MSAEETEDERNDRLNREIWRRMQQSSYEWKIEELMKLYPMNRSNIVFLTGWEEESPWAREQMQEILKAKWTREEPRGCTNKRCDGTERRPCRLLQYIETCTKCGCRMGEVPN